MKVKAKDPVEFINLVKDELVKKGYKVVEEVRRKDLVIERVYYKLMKEDTGENIELNAHRDSPSLFITDKRIIIFVKGLDTPIYSYDHEFYKLIDDETFESIILDVIEVGRLVDYC